MKPSSLRIGVVDDHQVIRYVAVKLLHGLGYQTVEGATGGDALRLASSGEATALLLDVNLPDVNGVKVCEEVKRLSPSIPIVLMSAVYTDGLHRGAGLAAGADGYLTSPLSEQEVGRTFDTLLGVSR